MQSRRLLVSCAVCILCVAGAGPSARSQGTAFDPKMTLEQTLAWLGKQLTHQQSVISHDKKFINTDGISLVKAKGCTLSYIITQEKEELNPVSPVSPGYQLRERWVLDLSALDPERIMAAQPGRVHFAAANSSREAIRTTVLYSAAPTVYGNKKWGAFSVGEKVAAEDVAAGLRHAVKLCRQSKP
jgi:hypothetical protein